MVDEWGGEGCQDLVGIPSLGQSELWGVLSDDLARFLNLAAGMGSSVLDQFRLSWQPAWPKPSTPQTQARAGERRELQQD